MTNTNDTPFYGSMFLDDLGAYQDDLSGISFITEKIMTNTSDTQKNLEAARQQLAEHMKYCDLCKAGWHCATRAELEQFITLASDWLVNKGVPER